MSKIKEKYTRIFGEMEPLKQAKKATIHKLGELGRRFPKFRYPIFIFSVLFIFLYNVFFYTLVNFKVHKTLARAISWVMVLALVLTSLSLPAAASGMLERGSETTTCPNHPFHDETCGFVEAVEGHECNHVHDDSCYETVTGCVHVHDDSCYETVTELICGLEEGAGASTETVVNEDGTEEIIEIPGHVHTEECYQTVTKLICTHECSEESGCITKELNCKHVHNEECGYVEAVEGHECEHTCELCGADHEEITEAEDVEKTEKVIPEEEVEFEGFATIRGIEVSAYAPAGVFPEGATLDVQMITSGRDIAEIEETVCEKVDETTPDEILTVVEESFSFDIKVLDKEGNEIEPDTTRGNVDVTFKNVGVAETENDNSKDMTVLYVTDDYADAEVLDSSLDAGTDSATISAEHFSIYTIVITSGVAKDTILHYYQGTSRELSYFTIYNETQLIQYKDLLNNYVAGSVHDSDSLATILVNADDANPLDGITGLGQSADLKIADINFNVKIMDDITVGSGWRAINSIPAGVTLDGAGHTLNFGNNTASPSSTDYGVLVSNVQGSVRDITIKCNGNTIVIPPSGELPEEEYASVTIRVDGEKADIGKAITGAEALAVSSDGINFITLERSDDLSVYRTLLSNLEPETEYHVYYVYEDENETISAISITYEEHESELNYVSVTYDLEYASTYSMGADGKLSENVMAAVRVDKLSGGTYEAQEDYEAYVKAIDGHEIPTRQKNVTVKVKNVALTLGTDYNYTYDSTSKTGMIHIAKEKISGPIHVTVKADSLEDNPSSKITLKTKGGSVSDPIWEFDASNQSYSLDVYENTTLPTDVNPLNGTSHIKFDGWYTDINCTGSKVTQYVYSANQNVTYYAKWVVQNAAGKGASVQYLASSQMDIRGVSSSGGNIKTVYSNAGYTQVCNLGSFSIPYAAGKDIFTRIGESNIYVARIYTIESNYITMTYMFENRGTTAYNASNLWFGLYADVMIDTMDRATVKYVDLGTSSYITMTDTSTNNEFRLYASGAEMGVDALASWWYGDYGFVYDSNYWYNQANIKDDLVGIDSGLTYAWKIGQSIPAGGYVTRSTKMGVGNANSLKSISGMLFAGSGKFADNTSEKEIFSDKTSITVYTDGKVTASNNSGDVTINPPTRTGYVFSHWSTGAEGGVDVTGGSNKTYKDSVKLYANWVPKPDRSLTNDASVQKVNGSDNLLVPETLANIVIENTTPGVVDSKRIVKQGQTVTEAAGYASGFSGIISMEGADDRYLLPDDIEVIIVDSTGKETLLTKGTGYTYELWNNRKKATLEIRKQYINGDVIIRSTGYELPPVTATSVTVAVSESTIKAGERATFTAHAQTSKNHVASYQWYVAPYHEITLDNVTYWDFQNQDGTALQNGTYVCDALNSSGNAVTISGANKATLRITGLDVNKFTGAPNDTGLHKGGYHIYCVVTSTRNITGQEVEATSNTVEVEVATNTYTAPTGLEGSATTYYGSSDGSIEIEEQDRTTLLYKLSTAGQWQTVSAAQLAAGKIDNLPAGTYQFKYQGNTNFNESAITNVIVEQGKYIIVTYRAPGADNESERTQIKHVAYQSTVTAATVSLDANDGAIVEPAKAGFTFKNWSIPVINNITENTTVTAVYENAVYPITLSDVSATEPGPDTIYEKYSTGFYSDEACENPLNGTNGITVPKFTGHTFLGFFSELTGGVKLINSDGKLSENLKATDYLAPATIYARWQGIPVSMTIRDTIYNSANAAYSGTGITMTVTDGDGTTVTENYDPDTEYTITITNNTGKKADTLYIYGDAELKKTVSSISFSSKKKTYVTKLRPGEIGANSITLVVAYTGKSDAGEAEEAAREQKYTITYMEVDGSKTGREFSGVFDSVCPVEGIKGVSTVLPTVSRTGYDFGGWFTQPRGTGSAITEIPATETADNVTVYAKWIAVKYQIKYETNEGSWTEGFTAPKQYQHGGNNVALPTAADILRDNYEFLGWFDNESLSGDPVTEVNAGLVGDITYYAGWEILALHTITLPTDGVDGKIYVAAPVEGYTTSVYHGKDFKFTVGNASAYGIKSVKADGKLLRTEDGVYTISNVISDMTVSVTTELLVTTTPVSEYEASILLADGTTGYFTNLEKAIEYAVKYGSDSVIKIAKDLDDVVMDATRGHAFTIDLNGHTIGENAELLVEDGAEMTLVNSGSDVEYSLSVENRGTLTNGINIDRLINLGIVINNGFIDVTIQQDSEYYERSEFINNGSVGTVNLEDGFYVENTSDSAPEGLTGYTTIMNGNEYHVSFAEAVQVANEGDRDATIVALATVDNIGKTINIGNTDGKKITIDLNGNNISSGNITTTGDVSFINSRGSNTCISEITAAIDNDGQLEIGAYVKLKGATDNEGSIVVDEGGIISGSLTNEAGGDIVNNGSVTAAVTNAGDIVNNSSMNNVNQIDGTFVNNGTMNNIVLEGGWYKPLDGCSPAVPEGTVCKTDNPTIYYATIKEAVDYVNENPTTDPVTTITLLEDIDDLGGTPVVIDPDVDVIIDLDGHELGGGENQVIEVEGDLTFEDNGGEGTVDVDIEIDPDGGVYIEEDVTVTGDIDNEGTLENEGDIEGTLTNEGDVINRGDIDEVIQEDGTFINEEGGTVDDLTQTGGSTENEGTIGDAEVNGGGFSGNGAEDVSGKVAYVMEGEEKVYFGDLDSALEYSASRESETIVYLMTDIDGQTIDLSTTDYPAYLDLNGHKILETSTVKVEEGAELIIVGSGEVKAAVDNEGTIHTDEEVTISGPVENEGSFENEGTITGTVNNEGDFVNDGTVEDINQKDGTLTNGENGTIENVIQTGGDTVNEGDITTVDLEKGSFEGEAPENPISGEAQIGDKIYGDLESAIEDAGKSEEEVTIVLLDDVVLEESPATVLDNDNDCKINIDLGGHDISGGTLEIEGDVEIKDTSEEPGEVKSDLKVDEGGHGAIDEGITVSGDVENEGELDNDGDITGEVTNRGEIDNSGSIDKIIQEEGTLNNEEGGSITDLEEKGGTVSNEGDIEDAVITGGTYDGNAADDMNYDGAVVKVISLDENNNEVEKFYPSLEAAIEDAEGPVTIVLLDDIVDEDIVIDKPGITIDLNGHDIDEESTILVTEEGTDTVLKDSDPAGNGEVKAPVDNKGELTIEDTEVDKITNEGELTNEGKIDELTNNGDFVNSGETDKLIQNGGSTENTTEGTIGEVDFNKGSYEGKLPEEPLSGGEAQIGDTIYADLESAVEDANKSETDTIIEILDDTVISSDPLEIGNENGKEIVIDLGGHEVSGGSVEVVSPGKLVLEDTEGDGAFESDVKVDEGVTLVVEENTLLDGDVINEGTTENNGIIGGNVTNEEGAGFDNKGEIDGNIDNEGQFDNEGDILGSVTNGENGDFDNKGEDAYIGGSVTNEGDMTNEGIISGEVDNTGNLENEGNIDNNIINRGDGTLDNSGNINGQLENRDDAVTENSGDINQVNEEGGSIHNTEEGEIGELILSGGEMNNEGDINEADITDMGGFTGNEPEQGMPGADVSVTTIENDVPVTRYYETLEEALEKAGEAESSTVTIIGNPVVIEEDLVVSPEMNLVVSDGAHLIISHSKLDNQGELEVKRGGKITIENDAEVDNAGKLDNSGEVDNNGNLVSDGEITNSGDISNKEDGTLTNNGTLDNEGGSINGDDDATGTTINDGKITGGEVNGPLENNEDGQIELPDKLSGEIENGGTIIVDPDTDVEDVVNIDDGKIIIKKKKKPAPKPEPEPKPEPAPQPGNDDGEEEEIIVLAGPAAPVGPIAQITPVTIENISVDTDSAVVSVSDETTETEEQTMGDGEKSESEKLVNPGENNPSSGDGNPVDGNITRDSSEDNHLVHWFSLLATMLYLAGLYGIRNKGKKEKLILAAADVVAASVLMALGDCSRDWMYLTGNILTAVPALNIIRSSEGEGIIASENKALKKVALVIAGLGIATLATASVMCIANGGTAEAAGYATVEEVNNETETAIFSEIMETEENEPATPEVIEAAAVETVEPETEEVVEATTEEVVEETVTEAVEETAGEETTEEATDETVDEPAEAQAAEEAAEVAAVSEPVEIQVVSGMSSYTIARLLEEAGVVESASEFDRFLCAEGYDCYMKVGNFEVSAAQTYEELAHILTGR